MMVTRGRMLLIGCFGLWAALPAAALRAQSINLTGLPAYPHLSSAAMDKVLKTETLGRWCATFTGGTSDPLATVESWYRKALIRASETDLAKDAQYNVRPLLTGIKLALGIDYVAVFRTPNEETTIELHRCSWTH
jgi:hypothetical protein